MNFKKWIKPGTEDVRFYISGTDKAFITEGDSGMWVVKCFGMYPSQLDSLTNSVENALADLNGGERFSDFSRISSIVK